MTTVELLSQLRNLDVKLWLDDGRLRYSAPNGALTPALRQELAAHKAQIIAFLRQAETAVDTVTPPITPVSRNQQLPLSLAQQRLWLLYQLMPESPFYNISQAVRLQGSLNLPALRQTLDEITRRHEILRTTFPEVDGRPVQVVKPELILTFPAVDLQNLPETKRETEARRLAAAEAEQPFDLVHGPPVRVTLLRLAQTHHVVLFTMHHIVADAWSMGVLVNEVATLYQAFSQDYPSPLPELPIQYADFAHWQQRWLQGDVLADHITYWKQQLAGAPTSLNLPTNRPRPAVQTFRGAHYALALPASLHESLKALSRQEDVTLFMTLLAAFSTLLFRYTGQTDIVVGSPIGNRNQAELEGLIGYFVNTLVLRTNLSGDPSFRKLLGRVREVVLGAFAHQELPFEEILKELRPNRDPGRVSLANVAFALQSVSTTTLELPGLQLSPLKVDEAIAKTDLILFMSEASTGLHALFEYNTDLFDEATIARIAGHFQTLLTAIVASPALRLSMLLPSPGESLSPLETDWSQTSRFDDVCERSNLTRNQLLIWTGQKLQPDAPIFNIANTFAIAAHVEREHFQRAFQTLINSSDALRTVIVEKNGVPQQEVIPFLPHRMEYRDFSSCIEPHTELRAWVSARCRLPFDFAERLFDSVLIKMSEDEYAWYFNQHHIIADAWSKSLIFRHMAELYALSLQGQLPERIELPAFQDYVNYEREYRQTPRYSQAKEYWQKKLEEILEPLTFYGKTPVRQTTRVCRLSCNLGMVRSQKLKEFAARNDFLGTSANLWLFSVFAAALYAYLYRISGNRRLAVGAAFHNRRSQVYQETIGMLMEVRPLLITVDESDTFTSLVQKVTREVSQTFRHRHYAVANPLHKRSYDVFLNYQTATFADFCGAPVQTEWVHSGHENDTLALQIHDFALSGSFKIDFDFHRDVFDEGQRAQAVRHFLQVLDALLQDSTQRVCQVRLLTGDEEHYFLAGFNAGKANYAHDHSLIPLYEERVKATPDKVAAVHNGGPTTFRELDDQASELAHLIRRLKS